MPPRPVDAQVELEAPAPIDVGPKEDADYELRRQQLAVRLKNDVFLDSVSSAMAECFAALVRAKVVSLKVQDSLTPTQIASTRHPSCTRDMWQPSRSTF